MNIACFFFSKLQVTSWLHVPRWQSLSWEENNHYGTALRRINSREVILVVTGRSVEVGSLYPGCEYSLLGQRQQAMQALLQIAQVLQQPNVQV